MAGLVIGLLVAVGVPGTVCAQYALEVPPDARSEGMGGAEIVLDPGPWAAWGNVGALGLFSGSGVVATRFQLVPDLSDDVYYSFGSAALAIPWGGNRLVFDLNTTHVGSLFYSMQPYAPPVIHLHDDAHGVAVAVGIRRGLGVGVGVKTVRVGSDNRDFFPGARATAFDFGIIYDAPWMAPGATALTAPVRWDNPRVGISASNLGQPLDLIDQAPGIRLPHVVRLAIGESVHFGAAPGLSDGGRAAGTQSSRAPARDRLRLTASVCAEKQLNVPEGSPDSLPPEAYLRRHRISIRGGLEARLLDLLALRAGYIHDDPREIKGFTFGAGLSWHAWAGLDFASVPQYTEFSRLKKFSAWLRVPFPAER